MRRKISLFRWATLGAAVALSCAAALPLRAFAGPRAAVPALSVVTLSAEEVAGLNFMREEEKLAHDVYVELYALWGTPVFSSIAASEADHTAAVLKLLNSYGLPDPAANQGPGVFVSTMLQTLYGQLMERGHVSEVSALMVGALIEETDIHDIRDRMRVTDETAILKVYDNLLCGSRNHLRSFDRQLRSRGVVYAPVVITAQEWDAIASSAMERCR